MKNLNKENAFLNAKVKYKNKDYYVVKINEKTVYLAESKDIISKWKNKVKGTTWKVFCEKNNVKKVSYGNIEIEDIEVLKGSNFVINKKSETKKYLSAFLEKEIKRLYKNFLKGKGSWKHPIEGKTSEQMFVIKFKDGQALVRFKNEYFFYDFEYEVYTFFKKIGEKKEIIWPREELKVSSQKVC